MEVLSDETFIWNMQVDTLSVQHDPANNNQTRYQRLCAPLGETQHASVPTADCNATIVNVESPADSGTPGWTVSVQTDDGARAEVRWSAPDAVRIMAQAKAPLVYFPVHAASLSVTQFHTSRQLRPIQSCKSRLLRCSHPLQASPRATSRSTGSQPISSTR